MLRGMIYKFKCKVTSDLLMMGPQGDEVLRLLGRAPSLSGILEVAAMPAAMAALRAAVAEEAAQPVTPVVSPPAADTTGDDTMQPAALAVSLRQRLWPMLDLIQRAHAQAQPVVWGV